MASTQRAQLPQDKEEECEGVTERERENGRNKAGGRYRDAEMIQRERKKRKKGEEEKEGRDEGGRTLRRKSKEGSSTVIGRGQITY